MAHLKVITGPMFSGKTEELIRILRRFELAGKRIVVVKPSIDIRTENEIVSRRKNDSQKSVFERSGSFPAHPLNTAEELEKLIAREQPSVLGLDEIQFFGDWLPEYLRELLQRRKNTDLMILAAGLDMDAWGRPFGIVPQLLAIADEVQKETAICFQCKQPAMYTQKLVASGQQVEVGDADIYEARCRVCHVSPDALK